VCKHRFDGAPIRSRPSQLARARDGARGRSASAAAGLRIRPLRGGGRKNHIGCFFILFNFSSSPPSPQPPALPPPIRRRRLIARRHTHPAGCRRAAGTRRRTWTPARAAGGSAPTVARSPLSPRALRPWQGGVGEGQMGCMGGRQGARGQIRHPRFHP